MTYLYLLLGFLAWGAAATFLVLLTGGAAKNERRDRH